MNGGTMLTLNNIQKSLLIGFVSVAICAASLRADMQGKSLGAIAGLIGIVAMSYYWRLFARETSAASKIADTELREEIEQEFGTDHEAADKQFELEKLWDRRVEFFMLTLGVITSLVVVEILSSFFGASLF